MGIDAKDVQVFLSRILKFSVNTCSRFAIMYPVVSGVVVVFFVLYLFLPSVFFFLLYSFPFLVCTAVFVHFYWKSKAPESHHARQVPFEKPASETTDPFLNREVNSSIQTETGRNVEEKDKESDIRAVQDRVVAAALIGDLVGEDSPVEEKPRGIMEEKESSSSQDVSIGENAAAAIGQAENPDDRLPVRSDEQASKLDVEMGNADDKLTVSSDEQASKLDVEMGNPYDGLPVSSDEQASKLDVETGNPDDGLPVSSDEQALKMDVEMRNPDDRLPVSSDEQASKLDLQMGSSSSGEDEEAAGENTNKAVEWTEDDQKNLMDLGISELERNRRLESLIARRRARKYKMPIPKSLIDMDSTHHVAPILITRINPFDDQNDSDEQIPGSAPSVLLPNRNPFDLPYDPHEEKPNLMTDSFQQEFTPPLQKDMFFCRHESFFLGPSFPALDCFEDEGLGFSRVKRQLESGDHEKIIEELLSGGRGRGGGGGGQPLQRTVSLTDLVEKEGESSEPVTDKPEEDRVAENENAQGIDSSLENGNKVQMETDGSSTSSSDDDKDIFQSNRIGISENFHTSSAFEFPGVITNPAHSSLPCPIPKAVKAVVDSSCETIPSPIDKGRNDELSFLGTQAPWHTPSDSIASDMQVEVSDVGSPPMTVDGTASSDEEVSLTYDGDIEKEITSGSEDFWGVSPLAPKMEEHQNGVSEEDGNGGGFSGFHEELVNPFASPAPPLSSSTTEVLPEDQEVLQNSLDKQQESLNFPEKPAEVVKVGEGRLGNRISVTQEYIEAISKLTEECNPMSDINPLSSPEPSVHKVNSVDDPLTHVNDFKPKELETTLESSSEHDRNIKANDDNPDNVDIPEPVGGEGNLDSTQENIEGEMPIKFATWINDSSTSTLQPEPMHEQVSASLNSSTSPTSVLPDINANDVVLSSVFNQEMHMPVQVPDTEVRNRSSNENLSENAAPVAPQNAQLVVEDSVDQPFISSSGNPEERFNPPSNATNETPVLNDEEEANEDAKSVETTNGESVSKHNIVAAEQLNPAEDINSRSVEHVETHNVANPVTV